MNNDGADESSQLGRKYLQNVLGMADKVRTKLDFRVRDLEMASHIRGCLT